MRTFFWTDHNRKSKESKKQDDPVRFSWADIGAFCLALYRLLLPQLIVTFPVIATVMYLIFFVWF